MGYALKITWRDGGEDYLRDARGPAVLGYTTREAAEERRERLLDAIGHEVLAIDIVPAPRASITVREL
jgi:hypothetical protein